MTHPWIRRAAWLPACILMVVLFLLSHKPMPELPVFFQISDKIMHMLAFGFLTLLLYFALIAERRWPYHKAAWWAAGISTLYGASDEIHQSFVPGRHCELLDWIADGLGSFLLAGILVLYIHFRKKHDHVSTS